jgi:hypothetical protein
MNELTPSKVESFSGLIVLMLVYLYYHVSIINQVATSWVVDCQLYLVTRLVTK